MNRRSFIQAITAAATAAPVWAAVPANSEPPVLLSANELARIKDALAKNAAPPGAADGIRHNAAAALKGGPWSVTFERPRGITAAEGAGPNDYYSEGPYWWPDPKNPNGPYIRRDGERNPDRFQGNRRALGEMCEAVLALGQAAFFLGDAAAAARANKVLGTWFLDPKTRMNPNLEFGQAVRGINSGRGTGIIDTVSLIHCATGLTLAEAAGKLDSSVASGVRHWFADYLKWMTTSQKGLDEKKASNNHATWWTAQAGAFATLTRDAGARRMAWNHYREWLVPSQIQPDGSCPREEARTRSLSYSTMNLDGFSVICRQAQLDGEDLWHFRTAKDTSVETAFHYLMPYVVEPAKWKKQQISPYENNSTIFPGLAGIGLRSPALRSAYLKLPRSAGAWVQLIDLLVRTSVA